MSIRLTSGQLRRLSHCLDAAATPLDFETADQWREVVLTRAIALVGGKAGHLDVSEVGFRQPALYVGYNPEATSAWDRHWRHRDPALAIHEPIPKTYTRRWRYRRRGPEWTAQYRASPIFNELYVPYKLDVDASGLHVRSASMQMHLHIDHHGAWSELDDLRARQLMRLLRPVLAASGRTIAGHANGALTASRLMDAIDCDIAVLDAEGHWQHMSTRLQQTLQAFESGYVTRWRERVTLAARHLLHRSGRHGRATERPLTPAALDFAGRRVSLVRAEGSDPFSQPVALLRVEEVDVPEDCPNALAAVALTARQWEVTRLLALGFRNQEIAETLGTSIHTVRRHTEAIMAKFGVNARASVASAVWRAIR